MNPKIMADEISEIIRERIENFELSVDGPKEETKPQFFMVGVGPNPATEHSARMIEVPTLPICYSKTQGESSYWANRKYESEWMYPNNLYEADNLVSLNRQIGKTRLVYKVIKNMVCKHEPKLKKEKDTKTPPRSRSQAQHNRIMALNGKRR